MPVINSKFLIPTNGKNDIIDITDRIKSIIKENKLQNALICAHCPFSGAGICVMEYEPESVIEFANTINSIVSNQNKLNSFLKSAIIGNSAIIPFVNGEFELDRFQRILLMEFDSQSRTRSVIIQIIY